MFQVYPVHCFCQFVCLLHYNFIHKYLQQEKRLPSQQPQIKAMIYFMIFTKSSPYTTPSDEPQSQLMWMVPISSMNLTVPLSPVVRLVYGSSICTSSTLVPVGYFSRSTVSVSFSFIQTTLCIEQGNILCVV